MPEKHLHIISFDIPYPPDYGGVLDVYYKLKALSAQGVKIHLHCFQYGRAEAKILDQLCFRVNYYPRITTKLKLFSRLPYIVASRESEAMMLNLLMDDYPILMEGLHSTFYLNDKRLEGRKIIVRSHNIEHKYYWQLAEKENVAYRKWYYRSEARKLKTYEPVLKKAYAVAAISPAEHIYIENLYGNSFYLAAFHSNEKINCLTGKSSYALYHGNLGVGENNRAALFLVNTIFKNLGYTLIIAGKNPTRELVKAVKNNSSVQLKVNPSHEAIQQLITEAQINILPTFQSTGIKLKLLNALFNGRFCIVNKMMVEETGLDDLCIVADTAEEMIAAIKHFRQEQFTQEMIRQREDILMKQFNNTVNAKMLLEKI